MAERRADEIEAAGPATPADSATADAASDPLAQTAVSSSVDSGDFVDAVLEVAESRAASSAAEAQSITTEAGALASQAQPAVNTAKVVAAIAPSQAAVALDPIEHPIEEPSEITVTAEAKGARLGATPRVHEHELHEVVFANEHLLVTRPTPWWRKRLPLEMIFAAIATVLMVVGLALVIAELF